MTNVIPFSRPALIGNAEKYLVESLQSARIAGDNAFSKKCHAWIQEQTGCQKALLTTSGTHALEMGAMLSDIKPGDEVIMPSFTFSSTATSFAVRGAKIVFVDIRPDTLNLDEALVEAAITPRTRAIVPVHYAGVGCEMDTINDIARRHRLFVVEDAAQGVMATYRGKALGTLGDVGCFSFHETKNYTAGEGGALLVNRPELNLRSEIYREKGTNRAQFFRGEVDKYTWLDLGSSYLPSDLIAAVLLSQLELSKEILEDRMRSWNHYARNLQPLAAAGLLELPSVPAHCQHNAHCFYVKVKNVDERTRFIGELKLANIHSVFHYVPLHSSPAGERFGRFHGEDAFTTKESERLTRLPLFYGLAETDLNRVVDAVWNFFGRSRQDEV